MPCQWNFKWYIEFVFQFIMVLFLFSFVLKPHIFHQNLDVNSWVFKSALVYIYIYNCAERKGLSRSQIYYSQNKTIEWKLVMKSKTLLYFLKKQYLGLNSMLSKYIALGFFAITCPKLGHLKYRESSEVFILSFYTCLPVFKRENITKSSRFRFY